MNDKPIITKNETAPLIVRINTCHCGQSYVGKVEYSRTTQALTGEHHVYCPKCGRIPFTKSEWKLQVGGKLYDMDIGEEIPTTPA